MNATSKPSSSVAVRAPLTPEDSRRQLRDAGERAQRVRDEIEARLRRMEQRLPGA